MTDPERPVDTHNTALADALTALRAHWGWFVALGVMLLVLGTIAIIHIVGATLVSVLFIGILMLIGGIGQLIHAWRVRDWAGFLFWTVSGLFYAGAGVLAIVNPVAGASLLTLLFGASLIAVGALRLWIWLNNRAQQGAGWLALSGVITLLTGILIAINWPGNSVWILGLLLAIDLFLQGWAALFMGLALRAKQ
ncbi:HdeD family acid-resistance protein [Candidimonas sp. SYP-B2681]|uniref:HdeD family acid-resistance protein n=1 Tax=Candidimonas sp. SYP-B2681 TaxID=2497686 RepID=UPI000F880B7C|nr:HdeD family acid-resistance protein [Candidimonas sp. SYP-B2681]RTZ47594.1 HdeD family acid-resistance protein [Candidimonas sp. SYP-B2681]